MNTDLLCTGKTLEDTNWGNRGFSETEVNLTEVDDLLNPKSSISIQPKLFAHILKKNGTYFGRFILISAIFSLKRL